MCFIFIIIMFSQNCMCFAKSSEISNIICDSIKDSITKLIYLEKRSIQRKTNSMKPIGFCKITGYSYNDDGGSVNYYTSTGVRPKPYKTCAVDPKTIPYGTKIYIPELNLKLIAEDCGGAVVGNHIDVHVGYDNPEEIIGNNYHKVYIYKNKGD